MRAQRRCSDKKERDDRQAHKGTKSAAGGRVESGKLYDSADCAFLGCDGFPRGCQSVFLLSTAKVSWGKERDMRLLKSRAALQQCLSCLAPHRTFLACLRGSHVIAVLRIAFLLIASRCKLLSPTIFENANTPSLKRHSLTFAMFSKPLKSGSDILGAQLHTL